MLTITEFAINHQTGHAFVDSQLLSFSWKLLSNQQGVSQTSYDLQVLQDQQVVWSSGTIAAAQAIVRHQLPALAPLTAYQVILHVKDNFGELATKESAFTTTLFDTRNFAGDFIACDTEETVQSYVRTFSLVDVPRTAKLCVTALGIYEVTVNGKKVGNDYFAPGWTSYGHRLQYQIYELHDLLKEGENEVTITVAPGWYKGYLGFVGQNNLYGDTLAVLAMLTIGQGLAETCLVTDDTWQVYSSPIRTSEIYYGERIDSTHEKTWLGNAKVYQQEKNLVFQESEPVQITEKLPVVASFTTPKGELVYDFGQNFTGFVGLTVCQPKGTTLVLRHAEVLDQEGNIYTENLRAAISTDTFVCDGTAQYFQPTFTFHGFRYVCIEGYVEAPKEQDLIGLVLHTAMHKTGYFACSNEKINRLQKNIEWGQRSNFLDIPTDCPQRDERMGWTGDAQVFASTALFNFDGQRFFQKWLKDLALEQTIKYGVPHVVPNILGSQDGAAAWGDAATIIPWRMYEVYGDRQILDTQYESMKGWVEYIRSKTDERQLWQQGYQYGDWVALDKEEGSDRVGATDVYLIASAYYAYSTNILAKTAKILGKEEDAKTYQDLYQQIIRDFNEEYLTKTGRLVSETQTACILALHFQLADEVYRPRILETLVQNLAKHNNHLVTGFVGTPYLCHTLSENNQHALAGKVFLKEDYPSWLYAVNLGATTIWERWDSMKPDGSFDESGMNSFNHYAYGSIGDWMYQRLAGIRTLAPGYQKIMIKPEFIQGITWVKASYDSIYGEIAVHWTCEKQQITLDVTIPVGTTAEIHLPEKDVVEVGSGVYHFNYATTVSLEKARYSMESTLEELFAVPEVIQFLEESSPGMTQNEMLKFVMKQSVTELVAMMPDKGKQLFEEAIRKANQVEEENKHGIFR
ncbi:family 78 glycoside hydrolase catalytic domain [Enterococcus casseliflavus]|uniref:family 78 glycoside hydrolase catalytic domain n=1 Tax=Enterococcus casseliflavus TaxID=37734 RepID=UPI001432B59C|nr:family 78 glycoside hydrolase catalytic domain [Enterococcus casseliflavus]NKD28208.1 family 78 glycoside hydrolase catalytic domain [Enterococcus casseliflavus]